MDAEKVIDFADKIVSLIKKIPTPLLYVITSISILMLFWFVPIFLFNNTFYNKNPLLITVLFTFTFSLTWFIINTILSLAVFQITENVDSEIEGVLFLSGFISIVYLCGSIVGFYISKLYYYPYMKFSCFLLTAYSYSFFRLLRVVFYLLFRYEDKQKPTIEN